MEKKSPAPAIPVAWFERPVLVAVLLGVAVALAWANSFSVPFHFDDQSSIVENVTLRQLWPPGWLVPPAMAGETVSGRPVLNFSFALNYAAGGLNPFGYHAANLLIHASGAWLLWAVLRRVATLRGTGAALAVALVWAVHPLQTAAVTYAVQRAEALAACFCLLTLYAFLRGNEAGGTTATRWRVLAVTACFLAMGTKESVAATPLLALLFDRAFVAGSFAAAWRARGRWYLALASSWLLLLLLVLTNRGRGGSAGLATDLSPVAYALTQAGALLRYLQLTVWPVGQVFDHGAVLSPPGAALMPAVIVAGALGLAGWGLARNRAWGFGGAVFFLLLAPSSSVVPVATQTIAEHRMYLPLAGVIALLVAGIGGLLRRARAPGKVGVAAVMVVTAVLGGATFARNRVYASELALWTDTATKRPENPRAHYNRGVALLRAGKAAEATDEFNRTLALQPNHAFAHFQLGNMASVAGRWDEAERFLRAAVAADPRYADAQVNLAEALSRLGRSEEALTHYETARTLEPSASDVLTNLGGLLVRLGRVAEGETHLRAALAQAPDLAAAHYQLGLALTRSGRAGEADAAFARALALKPDYAVAHLAVGNARAARGDAIGAETAVREALRFDPRLAEAHFALGNLRARAQRFAEAMTAYGEALALEPNHVQARTNLANCQLVTGRFAEAIANYEAVLRIRPGEPTATRNLALAREQVR